MNFAARLQRATKKKGIKSQYRLAKLLKLPATTVNSWYTGKAVPKETTIVRLSDLLGVSPSWLRFGEIQEGEKNYELQLLMKKIEHFSKVYPDGLTLVQRAVDMVIEGSLAAVKWGKKKTMG